MYSLCKIETNISGISQLKKELNKQDYNFIDKDTKKKLPFQIDFKLNEE